MSNLHHPFEVAALRAAVAQPQSWLIGAGQAAAPRRLPTFLTYICQRSICVGMNERTTVRLPAELLKRAKRKALAEGRTFTALIEEGLRQVVEEKRDRKSTR